MPEEGSAIQTTTQTTTTTINGHAGIDGMIPMQVLAAIVATHAAADQERRELRMLVRCGELHDVDAHILGADATALAERRAARLAATRHIGHATTIDLAIWDSDADGLEPAIRGELAASSLL